jgi:AraC-like DNA-binding protein
MTVASNVSPAGAPATGPPHSSGDGPTRFRTDDLEAAHDFLRRTYWDYDARLLGTRGTFHFEHAVRANGPCLLLEMEHNVPCEHVAAESGDLMLICVLRGRVERSTRAGTERFSAGDVFLLSQPGEGYALRWDDLRAMTMPVRAESMPAADSSGRAVRLGSLTARRPEQRLMVRRTFDFIDKVVLGGPSRSSDLVPGSAARLVGSMVATVFGADADGSDGGESAGRPEGGRGTLRRAMEFIESNADRDIGLPDIAAAAYASSRSVQLAFRRYLDTTPMAHLRRVRLERVHEELVGSRHVTGTTVTEVATRWGFASMGRFAQEYRETYGVLPSETLRS